MTRSGSAGDIDYDEGDSDYAALRRTDPRIARWIDSGLGGAQSVINVGAGAGSYEPTDRLVLAVEPSASMRAQRPRCLSPAIDATAKALPFDDNSFDAAMATITVHQWADLDRGLREMRRVSRGPVVILGFDPDAVGQFWLADFAPELIAVVRRRDPPIAHILDVLGGTSKVSVVPIPIDCVDGFLECYYARPESFLDPAVRRSQSVWSFIDGPTTDRIIDRLSTDLGSGAWDRRFGALRTQPYFIGSLRLIVAEPTP